MATCGSFNQSLPKLQDMCFKVIARNFDEISLKFGFHFSFEFLKRNPQQLLRAFKDAEGQFISLEHAVFCLHHRLWDLDLDWFHARDVPFIVNKLQTIETGLVSLSATVLSEMTPNVLWQLVATLPASLMRLSLRETNFSDEMLAVVAKKCLNLQILDLMDCIYITDNGVKALCNTDEEGNVRPNYALQKLNVVVRTVTKDVVIYILDNFPNLSELCHGNLGEVMWNIAQNKLNVNTNNLTSVQVKRADFSHFDGLMAVSMMCRSVTKLRVDIYTQKELEACENFTLLNDVYFDMYGQCDFSSFFEKRGKNLQALTINNCARFFMSLESVLKYCCRLEYLSFRKLIFSETMSSACSEYRLNHLTEFLIELAYPNNLLETVMLVLTQSENLKKLVLINSEPYPSRFMDSLDAYVSGLTVKKLKIWKVDVSLFDIATHRFRFELWL